MKTNIVTIPIEEIFHDARQRALQMSGFLKIQEETMKQVVEEQYKEFLTYFEKISQMIQVQVSMIAEHKYSKMITHTIDTLLGQGIIKKEQGLSIQGGLYYLIYVSIKENEVSSEINESILAQLYLHMITTSYLDSGRSWIKKYGRIEKDIQSVGPGFFGIPLEEMKEYYHICQGEKIGVTLLNNNTLMPKSSCLGCFFITERNKDWFETPCFTCKGGKENCMFCGV